MATKAGRPVGSRIDDEAVLDGVEEALRADPDLSRRAAIIAQVGDEAHLLRRIERKLAERARMLAGDASLLGAKPFEKGEARATALWSCLVDVPCDGRPGMGVTHSVVVGLPVLTVVEGEQPVEGRRVPGHHVLRAVDRLPVRYGWDHPGYRACCEALGIDPDRGRVLKAPRLEQAVLRMRECLGHPGRMDDEAGRVMEDLVPAGRDGKLSGHGLARFHARHVGDDSEEGAEARAEAKAAFDRIDWPRSGEFTTLRWLAGPWGYDHHASIYFLGEERDGLMSVSGKPEIIAAPDAGDWVGTHAARLTERHCMTVALSGEEMHAFARGGDRGYWLAQRDWGTKPWDRAKAEIRRPDLSMTHAVLDAMTASAYAAHFARATGELPAPDAPLSHQLREPLPPSRHRSRAAVIGDGLRRAARELMGFPVPKRPWPITQGMVGTPWGPVLVARQGGMAVVRNGVDPLRVGDARVRLACEFLPAFHWRGIPDVTRPGFEMTDLRTGQPLAPGDALPVLEHLSRVACVAAGLPGFHGRVIPRAWLVGLRLGLALAACCLATLA